MWVSDNHYKEHVLCSIRLYQDGLLEVTPSFSSVLEESGLVTHEECSGLGVFLDDHSAEMGLKKGFRLATFRVRSAMGSEFEYAIQNVNDILIPYKLEQIEAKKAFLNSIKAAEARGSAGSEGWMQDPPSRDKTVGIYAELVSGRGFEGEKLFVAYELTTPHSWLLRTGDLSDGVGFKPKGSVEQQEIRANDRKNRIEGDEGMLQGVTQTALVASSMRTATTLPFLRPRWKGVHVSFAAGMPTRVIAGGTFFLLSCFAVILGVSYPFWIIPALMIVFVLGTGVPGPPPTVVLMKHKHSTGKSNSSSKYATVAKRQGYGREDREVVDDAEPARVAVFNHLMRFSFDVNEGKDALSCFLYFFQCNVIMLVITMFAWYICRSQQHNYFVNTVDPKAHSMLAPSAHSPTMVFQVFSTDWLGRHKLEGYGFHHLSDQPGSHDLEIRTWRPVGRIRDQMQDFFLGNAAYLKDEHFVDSVNKTASALNRFGVLTHSSGSVRIRVHTVVTDPRAVDLHLKETAQLQQQQDSSLKVKRTVNDILQSFRTSIAGGTPRRMMSASNSATSIGGMAGFSAPNTPNGTMRPSVSNILNSLNVSARDAKLNDILARARAKAGKGGANAEGIAAAKPSRASNADSKQDSKQDSKFSSSTTTQARGGIAAMDRLHAQLPSSNYGSEQPTPSLSPKNRVFSAPSTPGVMQAGATIDTPFANAPAQSYDPFIEKKTSKKVPPLGPTGGAHAMTPTTALAPIDRNTNNNTSTPSTARGRPQPVEEGSAPVTARRELGAISTPSAGAPAAVRDGPNESVDGTAVASAPNTARRAHRYDTMGASGDEAEAEEYGALLGELPPRRAPLRAGQSVSASADTVLSEDHPASMFADEEEEQPEDTPLLGTMTR